LSSNSVTVESGWQDPLIGGLVGSVAGGLVGSVAGLSQDHLHHSMFQTGAPEEHFMSAGIAVAAQTGFVSQDH
jgi:hypothetical protein